MVESFHSIAWYEFLTTIIMNILQYNDHFTAHELKPNELEFVHNTLMYILHTAKTWNTLYWYFWYIVCLIKLKVWKIKIGTILWLNDSSSGVFFGAEWPVVVEKFGKVSNFKKKVTRSLPARMSCKKCYWLHQPVWIMMQEEVQRCKTTRWWVREKEEKQERRKRKICTLITEFLETLKPDRLQNFRVEFIKRS